MLIIKVCVLPYLAAHIISFRCLLHVWLPLHVLSYRVVINFTAKYLQSQNPNAPSSHVRYGYTFVLHFTLLQRNVGMAAYSGVCSLSANSQQTIPKTGLVDGATIQTYYNKFSFSFYSSVGVEKEIDNSKKIEPIVGFEPTCLSNWVTKPVHSTALPYRLVSVESVEKLKVSC